LVGTWYSEDKSLTKTSAGEQTFNADGTLSGTARLVINLNTSTDLGAVPFMVTYSGIWRVEGDICIETLQKSSMPFSSPLPYTQAWRITDFQQEQHTTEDIKSGKKNVYHRKPATTEQHSQAFNKPWPEPPTEGWIQFQKNSTAIEYFDKSTIQQYGDIVGVWNRVDLSEAAIHEAREQASIVDRSGSTAVIMEKTFIYNLIDCKRKLIKPRDIRIYSGGRLVAESKYEGENAMNWNRIKAMDDAEIELMKNICNEK
jgi:hypothetical protein